MVFLMLVMGYLLGAVSRKKPLKIGTWEFAFPPARLFPAQITIASLNWALAASVLYVLLPSTETLSFPVFIAIFLLAQSAGLTSHVPGGIGVFESVVLVLLSSSLPASMVIGPLLVYRVMYYLLPLAVAALLLGAHEVARNKEGVKQVTSIFGQWVPWLVPNVLAVTTFVSGAILLLSGATPSRFHTFSGAWQGWDSSFLRGAYNAGLATLISLLCFSLAQGLSSPSLRDWTMRRQSYWRSSLGHFYHADAISIEKHLFLADVSPLAGSLPPSLCCQV
jgi:hypothetical protein